ncbi:serine/threonine-protein kinase [Streptomyces sp. NBC_01092]|uniref:serine/threonine-protein kinase n=1 Tax=Streptomyces sp. NBC_01092 TaxID=2903748 RepID=UPI0038672C34|nr:serine/threonine protein kinase [Streptomyces sp. NBC_01092]
MTRFVGLTGKTWTYDERQNIGRGGGGVVFAGSYEDGAPVAVKKVNLSDAGLEAQRRRDREIEIGDLIAASHAAEALKHVLVPLDHAVVDDVLLIVMPIAEGSLAKAIQEDTLDEGSRIGVLLQVAQGLEELHSLGILHRDLKADNVLQVDERWLLADFGISRDTAQKTATYTLSAFGTAPYVAPELWEFQSASVKSDLYALGVLAYQVLTGQCPFRGPENSDYRRQHLTEAPADLGDQAPTSVAPLIYRLLQKDPARRPRDARAVVEALRSRTGPLTPAQQRLATRAQQAEARRLQVEAKVPQSAPQREDFQQQAYAELSLVLEEAENIARPIIPELTAGASFDERNFWLLVPGGRLEFEGWSLDSASTQPLISAGAVYLHKIAALNIRDPHANILCEKEPEGRLSWHIVQFEASPYIPYYSKGPRDRAHGLSREQFIADRYEILRADSNSWTMTKQKLNSDVILELLGDLISL